MLESSYGSLEWNPASILGEYEKLQRIEELSTMHIAKALQINGRQGVKILQYYIKQAANESELQAVLESCLRICLEKGWIYTFVESSREANKIEVRKWIAQVRSHLKYEGAVYSSLSYSLPSDFRKPSIEGVEAHRFMARIVVDEAIGSVRSLHVVRKKRTDETRESLLESLAKRVDEKKI